MSFTVGNLALQARHVPLSARHVLNAMAYFGSDDGGNVYARVAVIAERACLSVRQVQRIMHELEKRGFIVCERHAGGHRPAQFRIVLPKLVCPHDDIPEVTSCHLYEKQGCQDVTSRGDTDVTSRGDTDVTSIKTREDTRESPTIACARGASPSAVDEGHLQTSLMLPILGGAQKTPPAANGEWAAIWCAFQQWPGLSAQASEPLARIAWQRSVNLSAREFIACVEAHGRKLEAENRVRGSRLGPTPCVHPHNWIERDQGWRKYMDDQDALYAARDLPPVKITLAIEHVEALRSAGLSEVIVATWFADGEYRNGSFLAGTLMKRNWIAQHYSRELAKAFGAGVTITVKPEAKRDAA